MTIVEPPKEFSREEGIRVSKKRGLVPALCFAPLSATVELVIQSLQQRSESRIRGSQERGKRSGGKHMTIICPVPLQAILQKKKYLCVENRI